MIRSNGNYIAVKVPEGSSDFEILKGNLWYYDIDRAKSYTVPHHVSGEIIGLISEVTGDKQKIMDHMAGIFWASHQSPVSEWNQWLIIKKNG